MQHRKSWLPLALLALSAACGELPTDAGAPPELRGPSLAESAAVDPALLNLTYECGNTFRVTNANGEAVTVGWDVYGTDEAGTLTVPANGEAYFTTANAGTTRLSLDGSVIRTKANGGTTCAPQEEVDALVLTYMCGNDFRVRNPTERAFRLTWDVYGTEERGVVVVAAQDSAFFTTEATGTVRLFHLGEQIDTKANGAAECEVDAGTGLSMEIRDRINLRSNGKLAVVVYGSEEVDLSAVDGSTLTLGDGEGEDVGVETKGRGRFHYSVADVDGDGTADLVAHFSVRRLVAAGELTASTTELVLSGATLDGTAFSAADSVQAFLPGGGRGRGR